MSKLKGFFQAILLELIQSGKMLSGYILLQLFGSYPLVLGAAEKFLSDPSKENGVEFLAQLVLAFGAGARVVKVLRGIIGRMIK